MSLLERRQSQEHALGILRANSGSTDVLRLGAGTKWIEGGPDHRNLIAHLRRGFKEPRSDYGLVKKMKRAIEALNLS